MNEVLAYDCMNSRRRMLSFPDGIATVVGYNPRAVGSHCLSLHSRSPYGAGQNETDP